MVTVVGTATHAMAAGFVHIAMAAVVLHAKHVTERVPVVNVGVKVKSSVRLVTAKELVTTVKERKRFHAQNVKELDFSSHIPNIV